MSLKPAILPELYCGDGSWDVWFGHFQNVAAVNNWGRCHEGALVESSDDWSSPSNNTATFQGDFRKH